MKNRFRILLPLASFAAALTSLPAAAAGKEELVEIDTTLGNIVVRLAPDRAPITVKNFSSLMCAKAFTKTPSFIE